ncbi:MAG: phage tail tape measure protein, partial [Magnetococcales bacterium]|nr:phage tail tape measure protein [Magnetococcales bacterium]
MATAALEFTLRMNTDDVQRGMTRARGNVATGMRNMAQVARTEAQRIQSSLNAINLSQSLPQRINQTRTALGIASAEAARLGATFQRSQADLRGLTEQIGRASVQLARLQKTPASRRTSAQNAEILAIQQTVQNLRAQADAVRNFSTTLGRDHDRTRGSVARLNIALSAETAELTRLRIGLQASGIDTHRLAEAQTALQASMARTVARARELQRTQNARDVLNLGPRINTDRDVLRLQAAYERLRTTGNLTATELARAHVRMTEGIIALRNGTDSLAARFALVREQVAKLVLASAGIGLAVKEAIAFESAMSDVRKVVDFPTPRAFDEMTQSIKGMSREIPVGLVGMAKIAEAGGQMGIAAKDIQGFTEVVAKMSTAFKINPDEAGTVVGRLMNVFALTVPQTRLLADAINHLGNNTNAVEKDIVEVMKRTGG